MKYNLKPFEIALTVSKISNINYFEFTDTYSTMSDSHHFCEMLYVDKGKLTVMSDNFSGELCEGQMIIHRPDEFHSLKCTDKTAPNVIIIGFECDNAELEVFSTRATILTAEQRRMLAALMQEGMSVYPPPYDQPDVISPKNEVCPFGADQMIKIRLEMLLISLVRTQNMPQNHIDDDTLPLGNRISDVHRYINENYKEKITLDNICFLFGTNKTSLCKFFKEEYGETILSYINRMRIADAKVMLRESGHSVTEISELLGFNSIHYFCRLFKKETGQSPIEYTKSIKSKLNL